MAKGWKNESRRHSLASRGIKTAQKLPKLPKGLSLNQLEKIQKKAIKEEDERKRKEGATHKVVAWIHPFKDGDDYKVVRYSTGIPTKKMIEEGVVSDSAIKDDYRIIKL